MLLYNIRRIINILIKFLKGELKMEKKHKQYTFTDGIKSTKNGQFVLELKVGETENEINTRINQQRNSSNNYIIHELKNTQLISNCTDHKLRKQMYKTFPDRYSIKIDADGKEWMYMIIPTKIIQKFEITAIDKNNSKEKYSEKVLTAIGSVIKADKIECIQKIDKKDIIKEPRVKLRPAQVYVLEKILEAGKDYNILSLAPRIGKTYLTLEYAQKMSEIHKNVVLIPVSKSTSSNSSFEDSYNGKDYNFQLKEISLHKTLINERIEEIKEEIPKESFIILVTDEVDLASHTDNSQAKLEIVRQSFKANKSILMSGTGIHKAFKIVRNINRENIFEFSLNYSELCEMFPKNFVKRNFINLKIDLSLDSKMLSISESFKSSLNIKPIADLAYKLMQNDEYLLNYELNTSNCTMMFVNAKNNSELNAFKKLFDKKYGKEINTVVVNSESAYSNRNAEIKIKGLLKSSDKPLLIISLHMASRSFSIPEIDRCLILQDGFITNSTYQKMSRCLTTMKGKTEASIIRISTTGIDLAEELFLFENPLYNLSGDSKDKIKNFLTSYNSFASYDLDIDGNPKDGGYNEKGTLNFLDDVMKTKSSIQALTVNMIGEDLELGNLKPIKLKAGKSNVIKTSVEKEMEKHLKEIKTEKDVKLSATDEAKLIHYLNLLRTTIPTVCEFESITTLEEFLNLDASLVDKWILFDMEDFKLNIETSILFKNNIENIFEVFKTLSENEITELIDSFDILDNNL